MNPLTDHHQRYPSILTWHSRPVLSPFCLHLYSHLFPLLTLCFKLGSEGSVTHLAFPLCFLSIVATFFWIHIGITASLLYPHKSNQFTVFLKHNGQILTIVLTTLFYTGFFMDLTSLSELAPQCKELCHSFYFHSAWRYSINFCWINN